MPSAAVNGCATMGHGSAISIATPSSAGRSLYAESVVNEFLEIGKFKPHLLGYFCPAETDVTGLLALPQFRTAHLSVRGNWQLKLRCVFWEDTAARLRRGASSFCGPRCGNVVRGNWPFSSNEGTPGFSLMLSKFETRLLTTGLGSVKKFLVQYLSRLTGSGVKTVEIESGFRVITRAQETAC